MELFLRNISIDLSSKKVMDMHLAGFKVALKFVHIEGEAGDESK